MGVRRYTRDEVMQNQAAREFPVVHRFSPNEVIQDGFSWFSYSLKRNMNVLRYLNRLVKLGNQRLTKHVGFWCYGISNTNWS